MSVTRTVTLPTVAVVGARTSGNNFSIVCGPRNVPAFGETDCAVSLVDAPFTCQAMLKDRFSNPLGSLKTPEIDAVAEREFVGVVAVTAAQRVVAAPAIERVVARAAVERVVV